MSYTLYLLKKRRDFEMKPNIGILNALCRITMGFTLVAWATAKLVKRPWRECYLIVAMLGGMKIGEGITRFCPLTELYKNYCDGKGQQDDSDKDMNDSILESMANPS